MNAEFRPDNQGSPASDQHPAIRLLGYEADIRDLETLDMLQGHLLNETRRLLPYGQAFLLQNSGQGSRWQVSRASDTRALDNDADFVIELERQIGQYWQQAATSDTQHRIELDQSQPALATYPFRYACLVSLGNSDDARYALAVFVRNAPWTNAEEALLMRLAKTYTHAWRALGHRGDFGKGSHRPYLRWLIPLLLIAIGSYPVQYSVLAPVSVIADNPEHITAPMNTVVKRILVDPNSQVDAGTALLEFEDLTVRNELNLARQQRAVAQARFSRANVEALSRQEAAYQLPILEAEYNLANERVRYAEERLQQLQAIASKGGTVIYTSRRDWEGRPVMVGEEILQLADPSRILFAIDLPTASAIDVQPGQTISVLLNDSPLGGYSAQLDIISYSPRLTPQGVMAYQLIARPSADSNSLPRIGSQGSAHLLGEQVPLVMQLLLRPLNYVRQHLGW